MVSALPAQVLVLKSILTAYLCGRTRRYMLLCCPGVTGPFFVELLRSEKALQMDRVRKFTGMAKATPAVVPARRDEDESLALFGELYQHEKERDMNLLEPMFSVEFEAIQVLKQARLCNRIDNVRIAYLQLLHFCDSDSEAQLFVIEEKTQQRSSYSI